jgi:hypothetical protein
MSIQVSFVDFSQIYPNGQVDPNNKRPEKWNFSVFTSDRKTKKSVSYNKEGN